MSSAGATRTWRSCGIDSLINFYLPACFRVGYLVRCCTWDGRPAGTAEFAMNVLQQCCVLLVHMLDDPNAKNEYVRTIAVAILCWQKWHDAIPGVCFAEESCEALLSRVGNRLESYRSLTGLKRRSTCSSRCRHPPEHRGRPEAPSSGGSSTSCSPGSGSSCCQTAACRTLHR